MVAPPSACALLQHCPRVHAVCMLARSPVRHVSATLLLRHPPEHTAALCPFSAIPAIPLNTLVLLRPTGCGSAAGTPPAGSGPRRKSAASSPPLCRASWPCPRPASWWAPPRAGASRPPCASPSPTPAPHLPSPPGAEEGERAAAGLQGVWLYCSLVIAAGTQDSACSAPE